MNGSTFRNELEGFVGARLRAARTLFAEFDRTKVAAALAALNQYLSALIAELAFWASPPTVEASASAGEIMLSAQPIVGDAALVQVTLAGQFFDQTFMFGSHGIVAHTWRYWNAAGIYSVVSSFGTTVSVRFPLPVEIVISAPATSTRLGAKTVLAAPPTAAVTFPLQKL